MFWLIGKLIKWSFFLGFHVYIIGKLATSIIVNALISANFVTSLEQKIIANIVCFLFFLFLQLIWIICFFISRYYKNKMKNMQMQYAPQQYVPQPQYAQQPQYYAPQPQYAQQPQYYAPQPQCGQQTPYVQQQQDPYNETIELGKAAIESNNKIRASLDKIKHLDKYKGLTDNEIITMLHYEVIKQEKEATY